MLFERTVPSVKILGVEIPKPQAFFDFLGFEKHVIQIREKRGVQIWPGWYDHASYYIIDLPPEKLFGPGEEVVIPNCVMAADYEFELRFSPALVTAFCIDFTEAFHLLDPEAVKRFAVLKRAIDKPLRRANSKRIRIKWVPESFA